MVSGPFCAPLGIEWTGGGKSRRRSRQQNVLVFACVRPHLLHSLAGMTDCGSHGCSCDRCSAQCAGHHSHVGQRLVRAPVVPRGMQVAALGSLLHAHVHYQGGDAVISLVETGPDSESVQYSYRARRPRNVSYFVLPQECASGICLPSTCCPYRSPLIFVTAPL